MKFLVSAVLGLNMVLSSHAFSCGENESESCNWENKEECGYSTDWVCGNKNVCGFNQVCDADGTNCRQEYQCKDEYQCGYENLYSCRQVTNFVCSCIAKPIEPGQGEPCGSSETCTACVDHFKFCGNYDSCNNRWNSSRKEFCSQ